MATVHAPPGRAGRLWLQHRLGTARRGADLLDQKLRILRVERERLALHRERTAAAWAAALGEAEAWMLRAALLGGERAVRLATATAPATVHIGWEEPMGVRYPAEAACTVPEPPADGPPAGTAALVTARERYRRALEAAVEHAAAEAAVRVLEAEEAATRRRVRAIEDRWIPSLEAALAELELRLEEDERADGLRLRWAAARAGGLTGPAIGGTEP
ncbi:V-type ATP synthase subunit D [Georgenia thermotolerans]|uniref:V-type ATPase, D subunit n=1 Tax=Georgenia thermotolerans TaxID=527326 RepID=A0A7J5UIK5_9MICO|nr:V-type ATP synthase subunit D [Georgenia thermotolerans]KAE8762208.1 V-type ATPase, D subunit [Georgenia thermotolerans]